ncbi:hypothetical protein HDE_13823 [Halotydeus destructor]|nr:hypothetical protein HDE_13823 [Halotydeus destructor]
MPKYLYFIICLSSLYISANCFIANFARPPVAGCELLGFPNATINECGYCVGGETGLDTNYGRDCSGVCNGDARLDCNGICNGGSFVDECTAICQSEPTLASNSNSSRRDCRGTCVQPELVPSQYVYRVDQCGYCRLQGEPESPFKDCSGQCPDTGQSRYVSQCDQCVTQDQVASILDECGNCPSQDILCPETCIQNPSKCGCKDSQYCYVMKHVVPEIIPRRTELTVHVMGFFSGPNEALNCVLQHQNSGEIISFPASISSGNQTAMQCAIKLNQEGVWAMALQYRRNGQDILDASSNLALFAYDKLSARFSAINPADILTTAFNKPVTVKLTGSTISQMPSVPLTCRISYSDPTEPETVAPAGKEPLTCLIPDIAKHKKSQTLFITPTFDGQESLGHPLIFTIIAPSPAISSQNCFISSDGLSVVIMFDRPVDLTAKDMQLSGLELCHHVLTSTTMKSLRRNDPSCIWATKVQFMIYLTNSIVENTLEVTFNGGILKEDAQKIARLNDHELRVAVRKLTTEWWSYAPKLVITGPSEIPRCGVFALTGHFSSPSGTADFTFSWKIERDDKVQVTDELFAFVRLVDRQNIILDSIAFEPGFNYVLTLQAESRDQNLTASHRIIKFDYDAPIVSVFSNILLPRSPLTTDQESIFWAETYVPVCVFPFQKVGLFWKVIDPKVRFNFSLAFSPIYVVAPFSIPEDQPATFYLSSFLGQQVSQTSGAGFTIVAQSPTLKAVISGGSPMATISSNSVYQWTCIDSDTHQPCTDQRTGQLDAKDISGNKGGPELLDRTLQSSTSLRLHSSQLEVNKELIFALQVFDAGNNQRSSETELLLMKVIEGNAPQVFMGAIFVNGVHKASVRSPHNLAIVVPAHTKLTIKGHVKSPSPIKSLKWESLNFVHALHWINQVVSETEIHSQLHIHSDHIFPYSFHVVKLIACSENDECSETLTQFTAQQGITGCQLAVEAYEEYAFVTLTVERCNIPPGYVPLVYQLFVQDPNKSFPVPLTVPQFSSVFIIPGPPAMTADSNSNTFSVQVCDVFKYCQTFHSQEVEVQPSSNVSQDGVDMIDLAKKYNTAGDPVAALSVLSVIMKKPNQNNQVLSTAAQRTVEYTVEALTSPSMLVSQGQVSMIYHSLIETLKYTDNQLLKRRALDAIDKMTDKAMSHNAVPDMATIDSTLNAILTSYRSQGENEAVEDLEVFATIRNTIKKLIRSAAAKVPLGSRTEFGRLDSKSNSVPESFTVLIHDNVLSDLTVVTPFNDTEVVEVNVTFDNGLMKRFASPWSCDTGDKSKLCHSVVFSVTLYPKKGPFPEKSPGFRLTPIVDVNIYAPSSGQEQNVRGYLNAVTLTMSLTGSEFNISESFATKCYYWSEAKQTWDTDGVHSSGTSDGKSSCWSGHLTAFTVIRAPDNLDKVALVGIVVGSFLAIVFLGLATTYCIHGMTKSRPSQSTNQLVN